VRIREGRGLERRKSKQQARAGECDGVADYGAGLEQSGCFPHPMNKYVKSNLRRAACNVGWGLTLTAASKPALSKIMSGRKALDDE
jgi:hypothetical protein